MNEQDLVHCDPQQVGATFKTIVLTNENDYPNLNRIARRQNYWNFHRKEVSDIR